MEALRRDWEPAHWLNRQRARLALVPLHAGKRIRPSRRWAIVAGAICVALAWLALHDVAARLPSSPVRARAATSIIYRQMPSGPRIGDLRTGGTADFQIDPSRKPFGSGSSAPRAVPSTKPEPAGPAPFAGISRPARPTFGPCFPFRCAGEPPAHR
jgi:hypothetical protein